MISVQRYQLAGIGDKLTEWDVESDVPMVTLSKLLSILRKLFKRFALRSLQPAWNQFPMKQKQKTQLWWNV